MATPSGQMHRLRGQSPLAKLVARLARRDCQARPFRLAALLELQQIRNALANFVRLAGIP
jgi:hypothetical protein